MQEVFIMDSESDVFSGFSGWITLESGNVAFPTETGVYVLRLQEGPKASFGRLRDKSDIMKIGEGDIWGRMMKYLDLHGSIGETAERIIRATDDWGYILEVAWKTCDKKEAQQIQDDLLTKYENDHHELPPLNRIKN